MELVTGMKLSRTFERLCDAEDLTRMLDYIRANGGLERFERPQQRRPRRYDNRAQE
jgi:hypothetical protein